MTSSPLGPATRARLGSNFRTSGSSVEPVGGGDIGRIGDDDIDAFRGRRPASGSKRSPLTNVTDLAPWRSALKRAATKRLRLLSTAKIRAWGSSRAKGNSDIAASRADIDDPKLFPGRRESDHFLDQELGLRPRDEHAGRRPGRASTRIPSRPGDRPRERGLAVFRPAGKTAARPQAERSVSGRNQKFELAERRRLPQKEPGIRARDRFQGGPARRLFPRRRARGSELKERFFFSSCRACWWSMSFSRIASRSAVQDGAHIMEAFVQPMVGDPRLGEIVGPDLLAPLPRPDLGSSVLGDPLLLLGPGDFHQPGTEDAQGLFFVPVLGFFVLAGDDHAAKACA